MLNQRSCEQYFPPKTSRTRRLGRERYPEAHIPSHRPDDRQRRPTAPDLPAFLRLHNGRRGHPARQSHVFRQGEIRTGALFFNTRDMFTARTSPNPLNCRTWPNPRALSRPPAKPHCTSPFFSAPSCTALPHSTFSTSTSRQSAPAPVHPDEQSLPSAPRARTYFPPGAKAASSHRLGLLRSARPRPVGRSPWSGACIVCSTTCIR
jgi:hypothetical protein